MAAMKALSILTSHPASVGETYGQHLVSASGFGLRLFGAGAVCLLHALLPFLFQRTASRMVSALHTRMIVARARAEAPGSGETSQAARA
jgi:hypothetical protein